MENGVEMVRCFFIILKQNQNEQRIAAAAVATAKKNSAKIIYQTHYSASEAHEERKQISEMRHKINFN